MIGYKVIESSDKFTLIRTQKLSFETSNTISYENFISNSKLISQVQKIDQKYGITSSLDFFLKSKMYKDIIMFDDIEKRNLEYKIWDEFKEEMVLTNDTKEHFFRKGLRDELPIITKDDYKYYKVKLEFFFDKGATFKKSFTKNYSGLYMVFLFLTMGNNHLFRCLDTYSGNIFISDSYNLSKSLSEGVVKIIKVDEFLRRGNTTSNDQEKEKRTKEWRQNNGKVHISNGSINFKNLKTTKEALFLTKDSSKSFGKDVRILQKEYPSKGKEEVISLCNERLGRNDTVKLEIEIEKNYRMVKPTVHVKHDSLGKKIDKNVVIDSNKFGKIEIKKHSAGKYVMKHSSYIPSYIVWKNEKE